MLPPARWLEWKFNREFLLGFAETFKQWLQRGRHRNGERPIFAAFERRKCDYVFFEINAVHRQPRFPLPAASMQRNVKNLHFETFSQPNRLLFRPRQRLAKNTPGFTLQSKYLLSKD
ncbi:MAG: hypothetical protein ACLQSR_12645 [Limisphaerales bacterium]